MMIVTVCKTALILTRRGDVDRALPHRHDDSGQDSSDMLQYPHLAIGDAM